MGSRLESVVSGEGALLSIVDDLARPLFRWCQHPGDLRLIGRLRGEYIRRHVPGEHIAGREIIGMQDLVRRGRWDAEHTAVPLRHTICSAVLNGRIVRTRPRHP